MSKKVEQKGTLTIDDNNSLDRLGKKAKKTAKSIKELGGANQKTDRFMKGVTAQSSNTTKNFSKMAQTMQGGIVPIYATLAAQVFAVTAAFQFFQNSVDFANLIKGQEAFGAVTGVAYASLTKNIQAATAGQLRYSEAAQAAAIGVAAGLTSDQLVKIGEAAKNTSLALGRNLTDSFNRLTRGITKAEPELLDELGIVLRLEPALKAYAAEIGKSKEELNQFEKSQAIANEVLGQAERKFSKAAQEIDPAAFALTQFSVAFGELIEKMQIGLSQILLPVLGFLKDNVLALSGALLLFTRPIIASLVDFENMGKSAVKNSEIAAVAVERAQRRMDKARFAGKNEFGRSTAAASISSMNRQLGRDKFTDVGNMAGGTGQMSLKMIQAERKAIRKNGAVYKLMQKEAIDMANKRFGQEKRFTAEFRQFVRQNQRQMRADYFRHLLIMEQALKTSKKKQEGIEVKATNFFKMKKLEGLAFFATVQKQMVNIARVSGRAINLAFGLTGLLGVGALLLGVGQQLLAFFKDQDEGVKSITERFEQQTEAAKKLNIELDRMNRFREEGRVESGIETSQQVANMLKSSGTSTEVVRRLGDRRADASALNPNKEKVAELNQRIATDLAFIAEQEEKGAIAGVAAAKGRIERRQEEIEKLTDLTIVSEKFADLQEADADNILKIAEAQKSLGNLELANDYILLAEAIRKGEKPHKDVLDRLKKEEDAIISRSEKVARAEEIEKTFVQSLQGLAGKGGPFASQRSALRESIAGKTAEIDSFLAGGGIPFSDEHLGMVKDLKMRKDLQTQINTALNQENQNARDILANDKKRLEAKLAMSEEAKISVMDTKKLKDEEKLAAARAEKERLEIARAGFAMSEVTQEIKDDNEEQIAQAEIKIQNAKKELDINDKLRDIETAKLELKIAQNKHSAKQKAIDEEIVALQIGNVRGNAFLGGTRIGARLKKEQKIQEDTLKIKKESANITHLQAQLDKEVAETGLGESARAARQADIDFQKKKLELMEEQKLVAEEQLTFMGELQNTFAKGIEDMFVAFATGAKSAKDAFKDMALFMLKKMAEMAAQQLALRALGFMGMPVPMAEGGVIGLAKGGVIPKYRTGGIATEPTYLVGEGKMNEAVVPLPDGRSIPVNMKGGGDTNNVSISVNVDGSSTNSFDSEKGKALGKMIEASIMETIQREKRPGGVLG